LKSALLPRRNAMTGRRLFARRVLSAGLAILLVVSASACGLSGETSAPGLTSIVVQTFDPHNKTTLWIVDALGRPQRLETNGHLVTGP
jgi:hypothetical protein